MDIPSKRCPILEDLVRDAGHDAGDGNKKVHNQRCSASVGEHGREQKCHASLYMSPDDKKDNHDQRIGSEDELGRNSKACQTKEQTKDQLHGHEFHIVTQVVCSRLETVLSGMKQKSGA